MAELRLTDEEIANCCYLMTTGPDEPNDDNTRRFVRTRAVAEAQLRKMLAELWREVDLWGEDSLRDRKPFQRAINTFKRRLREAGFVREVPTEAVYSPSGTCLTCRGDVGHLPNCPHGSAFINIPREVSNGEG